MVTTLPSAPSLADARAARASGIEQSARVHARPDESAPREPAVVNHVRQPSSPSSQDPAVRDAAATSADAAASGDAADPAGTRESSPERADDEHAEEIRQLAKRDAEVRAHEQAHAAAGGAFAGAPSYSFQRGPDGRSYAVGGEVPIDVSAVSGDPEATIQKMQQVKRAALAPRDPSDADRAIAATADAMIAAARNEQLTEKSQATTEASPPQAQEHSAGSTAREAFSAYERRSNGAAAYAFAAH